MNGKRWMPCLIMVIMILLECAAPVNYNLPARRNRRVYSGLENFIANEAKRYRGKKVVIVTNHSGVDFQLRKNIDLVRSRGIEVCFILAPEHGIYGYENDYDRVMYHADERLNAVIYNLHHLERASLSHLLRIADVVIFDIQDMGMRCYTYISSLKLVMDALDGSRTELLVLDRPNPLGYLGIDGPYLEKEFYSRHVSAFPSTFMYNMTMGEAARYYRGEYAKKVRLRVVPLANYSRDLRYNETSLPWVPPSPNLPTYESSIVYAAIVMLEGINISVGRGTPKPFEYIGAPWMDPVALCEGLSALNIDGFRFRPIYFAPTFSKYRGMRCGGVQIFYVGGAFSPMEVSYKILRYLSEHYREFRWEYYRGQYNVDFLAGTDKFRKAVEMKKPYEKYLNEVRGDIKKFDKKRSAYLIY